MHVGQHGNRTCMQQRAGKAGTRTIMLNVVGFLFRFWLGRWRPWRLALRPSNALGGWDAYSDAMGGPCGLSAALPGDDHGLWKGTGAPATSAEKEVLAAPRGGGACASAGGSCERSTRLDGQGMPCAESSGSEGEVRMAESGSAFLGFRRKENIVRA